MKLPCVFELFVPEEELYTTLRFHRSLDEVGTNDVSTSR